MTAPEKTPTPAKLWERAGYLRAAYSAASAADAYAAAADAYAAYADRSKLDAFVASQNASVLELLGRMIEA